MFTHHSSNPFCYSLTKNLKGSKNILTHSKFYSFHELDKYLKETKIHHLVGENRIGNIWYYSPENINIGVWSVGDILKEFSDNAIFGASHGLKYCVCRIWRIYPRYITTYALSNLLQLDPFKREIALINLRNKQSNHRNT